MTDKLKPCPYQHAKPHPTGLLSVDEMLYNCWHVMCQDCDATGPIGKTEAEAGELWNCCGIKTIFDPDYKDDPETLGGVIRDLTEACSNAEKDRAALLDEVERAIARAIKYEWDEGAILDKLDTVLTNNRIIDKHKSPQNVDIVGTETEGK